MSFSFNGSQQFGGNAFANGVFISGASASASTGPVAPAQTALPIKSPKKLFLSYRRGTGAHLVQRLRTKLEPLYSSVFVDTESITGGAEWKRVIEKAIEECDAFVLLCTPDFLSKTTGSSGEWVVREFCMAVDKKKLILPILDRFDANSKADLIDGAPNGLFVFVSDCLLFRVTHSPC
eukprot:TRINITY_DN185_c0_g2_i3.p1 TRINITY_DN185_c0_g2~~TRINITY_DN185_c0_g2_i3.p1  ORF type:complete len:191 (-),score=48.66 TRINITY_DN185_c0_g2_i3:182-715(-)